MTRIELYGSADACAIAKRMIHELFDKAVEAKREKHVAQREREKERKADNRRLYHLRHARDYEARRSMRARARGRSVTRRRADAAAALPPSPRAQLLGVPVGTKKDELKKAFRKVRPAHAAACALCALRFAHKR